MTLQLQGRARFAPGAVAAALLMAAALYIQYIEGLEPCPLCMLQRVAVIAIGLVCLVATLHGPAALGTRLYGGLVALWGLAGLGVAARQIWLQYWPHEALDCAPGLDYMLEVMPLTEVLTTLLRGTGDCARIDWTLLGLSIPVWTAAAFLLFVLYGALLFVRPR